MQMTRRELIAMTTASAVAGMIAPLAGAMGEGERIPLWPDIPPGAPSPLPVLRIDQRSTNPAVSSRWLTGIDRPYLAVRRPAQPNGAAVLVIPGGGYGFVSWDNEGEDQARWLNEAGFTVFILAYRLPGEGWQDRATVPLADAQRGIRLIRANAPRYGIQPEKMAVLGFSAGGHLAGSLATRYGEEIHPPLDEADRQSAKPFLAGLIYPVVSMVAPFTHVGSRDNLFAVAPAPGDLERASVERWVDTTTPPLFIAHSADDKVVPIANGVTLYQSMLENGRNCAFHGFAQGGHGFGVRLPQSSPASIWPNLLLAFMRQSGLVGA